jgi:hypothetical protein
MKFQKSAGKITPGEAQDMAARALLFLAEEPQRLGRFLADTGLDPATLTGRVQSNEVLAAALGHVMEDESTLLAFAANAGYRPESLGPALAALGVARNWDST